MTENKYKGFSLVENVNCIKKELICNICLDIFKIPITLPNCLHTFCYECINKLISNNEIKCPICRRNNNIKNLNECKNHIIENIVKHIQNSPICNIHETEKLKYYCKNCNIFICSYCKVNEKHKKHYIILIKKNANKMINELNNKKKYIEKNTEIINNEIKLLNKIKNMSLKNYEKDKNIVNSEFNLLEYILNEKKQFILKELKYKYIDKYKVQETYLSYLISLLNQDLDNIKKIINDINLFINYDEIMKTINNNLDITNRHNVISSYNESHTIFYNSISKIINNLINHDFLISDENNVTIYIDKINDKIMPIIVNLEIDTINKIMEKIKKYFGISIERQLIYYNNKNLKYSDDFNLKYYDIRKESTLKFRVCNDYLDINN